MNEYNDLLEKDNNVSFEYNHSYFDYDQALLINNYDESKIDKNSKSVKKKSSLINSFVMMCTIVVTLPFGIKLPVFSELFQPKIVEENVLIEEYVVDNSLYIQSFTKDYNLGQSNLYIGNMVFTSKLTDYKGLFFVIEDAETSMSISGKYFPKNEIESGLIVFSVDILESTEVILKIYCYSNDLDNFENCKQVENSIGIGYLIYKSDMFLLDA